MIRTWRGLPGRMLRTIVATRGAVVAPLGAGWESDLTAIRETRRRVPMLLSDAAALQILIAVRAARRRGGAMAEAGVFRGGSARLICHAKGDAPLHLFDVFETLQAGATQDPSAGETLVREHFGAVHGARARVEALLAPYPGVHVHAGVFPDTAAAVASERFGFVHLDLDLPGATRAALAFFHPRLLPGAILIGDDYEDRQVREVFGAFFADRPDAVIELPWGQVMVVSQG
ncbi:MAG: TylF/MycF/NovP-related O-methyltransferase [Sphingomonas sp.]|uniref:TylF/MycF/NovP-related O-methyltransferase n=1 Tax=Sphingomonas sp. TaxID=28214 RepID=UPI003F7DC5AE